MGPAKSAALIAAAELARRTNAQPLQLGDRFSSPCDVYDHFCGRLRDAAQESFITVLLDGRHRVIGEVMVSRGTLTASLVHPREVFRSAIREAAAAIVLVHNHPSGDPSPSAEDVAVTQRLVEAGEIVGVRVVDHVIVAAGGYHSFSEAGQIPSGDRVRHAGSARTAAGPD
jgi:DNA repair protein RadC